MFRAIRYTTKLLQRVAIGTRPAGMHDSGMPNQIDTAEPRLEVLARIPADLDSWMATAAEEFKAREKTLELRRRLIQLAPLVEPDRWSNTKLAERFNLSSTAISNIRKEAQEPAEDAAYLLGGLIGLALKLCGEPAEEVAAREAAAKLVGSDKVNARDLYLLWNGILEASTRDKSRKGKARYKAVTSWWHLIRECPVQESAFDLDTARSALLATVMWVDIDPEYELSLDKGDQLMVRMGCRAMLGRLESVDAKAGARSGKPNENGDAPQPNTGG